MLSELKKAVNAVRTVVPPIALCLELDARAVERDLADRESRRERNAAAGSGRTGS